MIILDTNVVSEFMRPTPESTVVGWMDDLPRDEVWTTSITVAEISAGIATLPNGVRRKRLIDAFRIAIAGFDERILSFTAHIAMEYGTIVGTRVRAGRPISVPDAQIAAIAHASGAPLATRNLKDFELTGIEAVNPWTHEPPRNA